MKRLFAIFAALVLLAVIATGVAAQSGGAGFYDFETNVRMWQNLQVLGTTTLIGDIDVRDDMTVTGDLVTTGPMAASTFLQLNPATTIVLSFDSILTPTASYQPVSSTEAIGTASIAVKPAGTVLLIENVGGQAIVFTDTGTLKLSGNSTLGALDTAMLKSDGTNWIQVGESDN